MTTQESSRIYDLMDRVGAFIVPEGKTAIQDLAKEVGRLLHHLASLEDELYYTRKDIGFGK